MKNSPIRQISILGCGWLGLPLAKALIKNGIRVKGSTTQIAKTEVLQHEGITPYVINAGEAGIEGDLNALLSGSEVLIIDIPPGLRSNPSRNFPAVIRTLLAAIPKGSIRHILFISSTAVFPDTTKVFTEEDQPQPVSASGIQLLQAELLIREDPRQNSILRFGGLIGPNRHPVTILSRRSELKDGNAPVNLIHLDDCIGIITEIIKQQQWGHVFHGVAPEHPDKRSYYSMAADTLNITAPNYEEHPGEVEGKVIRGLQTAAQLSYTFKNPSLHP